MLETGQSARMWNELHTARRSRNQKARLNTEVTEKDGETRRNAQVFFLVNSVALRFSLCSLC
jgi:hypothetical protein